MLCPPAWRGVQYTACGASVVTPITVAPSSHWTRRKLPPSASGVKVASQRRIGRGSLRGYRDPSGGRAAHHIRYRVSAQKRNRASARRRHCRNAQRLYGATKRGIGHLDREAVTIVAAPGIVIGEAGRRFVGGGAGDDLAVAIEDAHFQRGRGCSGVTRPALEMRAANLGHCAGDRDRCRGQRVEARQRGVPGRSRIDGRPGMRTRQMQPHPQRCRDHPRAPPSRLLPHDYSRFQRCVFWGIRAVLSTMRRPRNSRHDNVTAGVYRSPRLFRGERVARW